MVHGHATRDAAKAALVERWDAQRRHDPAASRMILAATRDDVRQLNELARARLRDAGELGAEHTVSTERGPRAFAAGDRLMFLRNERGLGVRNGTLGTVQGITSIGQGIEMGCPDLAAEGAQIGPAQVVGDDHQEVRSRRPRALAGMPRHRRCPGSDHDHAGHY